MLEISEVCVESCGSLTINFAFRENIGETVIFQWIEKIRDILQTVDVGLQNKGQLLIEDKTGTCPNEVITSVDVTYVDYALHN